MPHLPSRTPSSAIRAGCRDAVGVAARSRLLAALLLGVAILLPAGGSSEAAETKAKVGAKAHAIPVKAPAKRSHNKTTWDWTLLAARPEPATRPYTLDVAREHAGAISLQIATLAATSIAMGIWQWGWGETSFHTKREGWFGKNTEYGGVDKVGHAWSAHVLTDYITWRLRMQGYNGTESAYTAALISGIAFLGVELGDGFSHYGASYEDFIASSIGIGFSVLRNTVPGLHDKVDFRMQYVPTGHGDLLGLGDYSGKKFLLAWKLAGFEPFKDGPFRYLEIHTGYYTRGYSDYERERGAPLVRAPYVGVGLNLSELLFNQPGVRDTTSASVARGLLKYIQVPYTYISSDGNSGR
jgi:hypothetical protein